MAHTSSPQISSGTGSASAPCGRLDSAAVPRFVSKSAGAVRREGESTTARRQGDDAMKYMFILNATQQTEGATAAAGEEDLNAMGRYNDELIKAGVLLAGEGLT